MKREEDSNASPNWQVSQNKKSDKTSTKVILAFSVFVSLMEVVCRQH